MQELNAVITRRIDIAPGIWIIYVTPDGWSLRQFEAGQYTTLGLPGYFPRCDGKEDNPPLKDEQQLIRRQYSIASSPDERNHLEFYMVLVEEGGLSPRLFKLHEEERLWLSKRIAGTFVLSRAPDDANLVFIATGTGISPYMSMLRTTLGPNHGRRIALMHGVRHSTDLGYEEELRSMERLYRHFLYIPTISRPTDEPVSWKGATGYVQDIWRSGEIARAWDFEPTPENTHIYICGRPAMIDDSIEMLTAEGFTEHTRRRPGQIHTERYW